ncbi:MULTISPECIES: hypothetical protein [unclassified Microbacterium]|uniref:hypothetical protein n=1 Tax=unclassified Microbacterium TaxID=2609290 RepID=UPI00214BDD3B|nr:MULTISPECIES: hypothetical protein [unclassified Microbacterium]MCR2783554.1 hypothetical protein [Microbacterium sp. zg.B96]MDL5351674.1 hypothetical protein [Microbacterium sp. zg-YB36]WIM15585.1 hypothetical protein QNO11_13750 [Microbacterium sp. zg-B96]
MKRIDIAYGGHSYSISGRDIADLREEILTRIGSEAPAFWLEVNHGEGQPRPTFLLITPTTELALTPIPGDEEAVGS